MRSRRSLRTRLLVLPVAAAMLVAACGGGGGDDESADAGAGAATEQDGDETTAEADAVLTTAGVDLGGTEVDPASEIETNLFPDLVVDDIGRGKKVNIRNIVPADKPVLLWMWAPH
jgi:hypothetical protein